MTLTFYDLCTAMDAAGVEVRVVLTEGERHVVQLVDFSGLRSLDLPADRGFDAAALIACCSVALCRESPLGRRWPELVALAEAAIGSPDVRVSGCGRSERLS